MKKIELTPENIETLQVGQKVITFCTGMEVLGVVKSVTNDNWGHRLEIDFIEPKSVNWGNDHFTKSSPYLRSDGFWMGKTWIAE